MPDTPPPAAPPPEQTTTPPARDNSTSDYPGRSPSSTSVLATPLAPSPNDQTFSKTEFASYFAPTGEAATDTVLDITRLEYQALAILSDGSTVDLSNTIEDFTWDELKGQWAMRFSLTLRDTDTAKGQIANILALGGKISFWWRLGGGVPGPPWLPIGLGTIWDWEHADDGLPSLTVTLYDDLATLMKSDAILVLWPPFMVRNAIYELIKPWAIPLATDSGGNVSWDGPAQDTVVQRRMKLTGSIADCMTQLLAEAFITEKTSSGYGQEYFPRIEFDGTQSQLAIRRPGTNTPIWTFAPYQATSNAHIKWSMENLITQLLVTGSDGNAFYVVANSPDASNNQNWSPMSFTINGAYPELGLIRRIQVASAGDSPDVLQLQAQSEMAYYGAPMRTCEFTTFDNPAVRRGDTVGLRGFNGLDDGAYHLVGVQHMPATRQMRIQLDSSGMFDHRRKSFDMILQSVVKSPDATTTTNSTPNGTPSDPSSLPAANSTAAAPGSTTAAAATGDTSTTGMFLNPSTGNWEYMSQPIVLSPFNAAAASGRSDLYTVNSDRALLIFDASSNGWVPFTPGPHDTELASNARAHGWKQPGDLTITNSSPPNT